MTEMTMTQAVEMLRGLIPDEDAVQIDDGATMWYASTLVDAVREHDDGTIYDLVVEPWGIMKLNEDGFRESVPDYRVRPRPYIWELQKNGHEVIATEEQSSEDMGTNGRTYMLDAIIPDEHADAAQEGEWDEYGFSYHVGEDCYAVIYYLKPW